MSCFPQTNCLFLITIDCYMRNSKPWRSIIDSFFVNHQNDEKVIGWGIRFLKIPKRFVWVVCRSITSDFILCEMILQLSLQWKRSRSTFHRIDIISFIIVIQKSIVYLKITIKNESCIKFDIEMNPWIQLTRSYERKFIFGKCHDLLFYFYIIKKWYTRFRSYFWFNIPKE